MRGTIVAINRHLGTVVVETEDKKCAVLETYGRISADVGDAIEGDWAMSGPLTVTNVTRASEMQMTLQNGDITRSEAIATTTII